MTAFLITGATGTIGRRLVRTLTEAGHRPRLLLRSTSNAAVLGPDADRVATVRGDYANPSSLQAALHGVDRVFLLSPNGPDQVEHECAVVDAAAASGVRRIVKISAHGAHPVSQVAFWRGHAAVEDHLHRSGVPSLSLRPTFSMANILGHAEGIRSHDVLFAPALGAPVAMVDPQDVADVAAHLLTAEQLPGRTRHLEVSGPAGLTFTDVAAVISRLTGRAITYHAGTDEETAAYLDQQGTPPVVTQQVLAIFAALRSGAQARPVTTVQDLLRRPATPLTTFLSHHAGDLSAATLTS